MPAYNFQKRFAAAVASGQKRQTIRALGSRRHARVGESVQLYTGMRTKHCRKLICPDPVCVFSSPVFICRGIGAPGVVIGGADSPNPDDFARADGFDDFDAMLDWLAVAHCLPFNGILIRWEI